MTSDLHFEPPSFAVATGRAVKAIAWRHLYKWISVPANFMPTFLFPLLFYTAFAGSLSVARNVPAFDYPAPYESFIFIFSLLQTCMFGGLATGFTIAGDFESGFMRRLMLCVRSRYAILLGYMLSTFARAALMSVVVTIVAYITGMRMPGEPLEIVAMYAMALTMSFVGTLWASGVMFRGRSPQVAPAMQMPMFILLFLAPVFFPIEALDGWIRSAASLNPVTYVMEASRGFLAGYHDHVGTALLCLLGMLIVLGAWGMSGVRNAEKAGG